MIGTTIHVSISSIEALVQRITEDLATHAEFENGDAVVTASALETIGQAKKRLADLRHEVEHIVLSPKWSDGHKTVLISETVGAAYKSLQFVKLAATTKADAASQAKKQLVAVPEAKMNETTDYLIGAEIRQRLRMMATAERMTLFTQAVASQNVAIRRAIETDPLGEQLIPQDFLTRVVEEYSEANNGKAWQRLKTLELVADKLRTLTTALDLSLQNFGTMPTFPSTPTTSADLKMQNPQQAPPKSSADVPPPGGIQELQ